MFSLKPLVYAGGPNPSVPPFAALPTKLLAKVSALTHFAHIFSLPPQIWINAGSQPPCISVTYSSQLGTTYRSTVTNATRTAEPPTPNSDRPLADGSTLFPEDVSPPSTRRPVSARYTVL